MAKVKISELVLRMPTSLFMHPHAHEPYAADRRKIRQGGLLVSGDWAAQPSIPASVF